MIRLSDSELSALVKGLAIVILSLEKFVINNSNYITDGSLRDAMNGTAYMLGSCNGLQLRRNEEVKKSAVTVAAFEEHGNV